MRFTQDSTSAANLIRAYRAGELKINDAVFRDPVIVSASAIAPGPEIDDIGALRPEHAAALLAFEPELVLLGTGVRQQFPDPEFGTQFLRAGIGFEVMDTGAACRTFNVLVAEGRRVAALLLP
jgi:uncharacterized protein